MSRKPMVQSLVLIALVLAIIGLASSIPNLRFFSDELMDVAVRKTAHVVLYFVLGLLVSRIALAYAPRSMSRSLVVVGVSLLMAAIAVLDETNQSGVIGRQASIVDVALDCIGAFSGVWVSMRSSARRARGLGTEP